MPVSTLACPPSSNFVSQYMESGAPLTNRGASVDPNSQSVTPRGLTDTQGKGLNLAF